MFITRSEAFAALAALAVSRGGQGERLAIAADDFRRARAAALIRKKDDMVIQLIHFTFSAANTAKAQMLLRELREASRKEEGVLGFDVARSQERANTFVLWEQYRDKAAQDAHAATEHFKRLVVNGVRTLAEQRDAEILVSI